MPAKLQALLAMVFCLVFSFTGDAEAQPGAAWLDGDPGAIWQRPPGLYEEGGQWYAILHTRSDVTRVQLVGNLTDGAIAAVELTRTPDGKFWWFKGGAARFTKPPQAGDCYRFLLTRRDGSTQQIQDPAARRVQSSDLTACSRVTISSDHVWHDPTKRINDSRSRNWNSACSSDRP